MTILKKDNDVIFIKNDDGVIIAVAGENKNKREFTDKFFENMSDLTVIKESTGDTKYYLVNNGKIRRK